MFKNLRNIFQKEEEEPEEVQINFLELDNTLKVEYEKLRKGIEKSIKQKEIGQGLKKLDEDIDELRNAKVEEKADPKLVSYAKSNKDALVRKADTFSVNTKIPDKINFRDYLDFSAKALVDIDELLKNSEKNIFFSNKLFKAQVGAVLSSLQSIRKTFKDLNSYLKTKKKDFDRLERIEDILNQANGLYQHIISRDKTEEIRKKRAMTEEEIRNLKSTKDYRKFQKNLKERKELNEKLKNLEDRITQLLSPMEKSLKKLRYESGKKDRILSLYISDPFTAFKEDTDLSKLDRYLKEIEGQSLVLNKKKREKTKKQIQLIRKSDLSSLKKKIDEVKRGLAEEPDYSIQKSIEKKQKQKEKIDKDLHKEKSSIKEKERKKDELYKKIGELKYELQKFFGKEVTISPPEI